MIGHHARFRDNDDLPLWRGPAAKKKPPFFNARALIRRKLCAVGMRNAILGNNLKYFYSAVAYNNLRESYLLKTQHSLPLRLFES